MPLDNKKLPCQLVEMLYNLPYQDKVNIYDKRCSGCGFMRVEVGNVVVRSIQEAIDIAQMTGAEIVRTCEYPGDTEIIYGEEQYPSLNDIVANTCRFWDLHNIEGGYAGEKLSE